LNNQYILKKYEGKTGAVQEWVLVGESRVSGESEGGRIWSMCFVYVYENRTTKPIEIILKSREGDE
jgi:hypothetical protein